MYGDTHVIRALARSLRQQGHRIDAEGDLLLRATGSTHWDGVTAHALRSRVTDDVRGLQRTAELHLEAANALDRHADEVDRRKHLIAEIEHAVLAMVGAARERLHGLAGAIGSAVGSVLPDAVDDFLDRFEPPPSGHRDWLTLHLPFHVPGMPIVHLLDGAVGGR